MKRWIRRLFRSRRVAIAAASGSVLLAAASCSGVMLANYTVSGAGLDWYAGAQPQFASQPTPPEPGWGEQALANAVGSDRAELTEASYAPAGGASEYAIGD